MLAKNSQLRSQPPIHVVAHQVCKTCSSTICYWAHQPIYVRDAGEWPSTCRLLQICLDVEPDTSQMRTTIRPTLRPWQGRVLVCWMFFGSKVTTRAGWLSMLGVRMCTMWDYRWSNIDFVVGHWGWKCWERAVCLWGSYGWAEFLSKAWKLWSEWRVLMIDANYWFLIDLKTGIEQYTPTTSLQHESEFTKLTILGMFVVVLSQAWKLRVWILARPVRIFSQSAMAHQGTGYLKGPW